MRLQIRIPNLRRPYASDGHDVPSGAVVNHWTNVWELGAACPWHSPQRTEVRRAAGRRGARNSCVPIALAVWGRGQEVDALAHHPLWNGQQAGKHDEET